MYCAVTITYLFWGLNAPEGGTPRRRGKNAERWTAGWGDDRADVRRNGKDKTEAEQL